jgi:CRISPR-associated endonuclease Csn1
MRRRRDRYLRRRRKLLRSLIESGLMPGDDVSRRSLAALDPYEIRARALDEMVPLHHLGRAIFHLNQRRGFKSNRKADRGVDEEKGKIRLGVGRLAAAIEETNARTLGEYLHGLHKLGQSVRARLTVQPVVDGKVVKQYEFYPERSMVMAEFDAIWAAQLQHYPTELTDAARERLRDVIFFQRRLKPARAGRCTFNPDEERLAKAHPLFQRRRIFQDANTLAVVGRDYIAHPLTREQRDLVVNALLTEPKRTFGQLRRLLKLPFDSQFNLESESRKDLKGDETAARLGRDDCFGAGWRRCSLKEQRLMVERLIHEEEEETLIAWLMSQYGLDHSKAEAVAQCSLPDGYGELGDTATRAILKELEADVIQYSEAAKRAGFHHSDFRSGKILDSLPYYGRVLERAVAFGSGDPDDPEEIRYGRIANPTVHIALNQLRRVVNALIGQYGHPQEIVVELARELKLNKLQRDKVNRDIRDNTQRAERHGQLLAQLGLSNNGENRMRLRLWEELNPSDPLDRRCPYTGEPIGIERLFSNDVEIDHILAFSQTLDDSAANRTVSLRRANREKRNRSPFEAFGHRPEWPDILARASALPRNKRWRFAEDAITKIANEERDFLARQLIDTQYLSRLTREYLTAICDPRSVWATPGRLTELLRRSWGLNDLLPDHNLLQRQDRKNRLDHRHHAIDAAVIGVTDRGLLNGISRAAARAEERDLNRLVDGMPMPWPAFRDELRDELDRMIVSHRPERGATGNANRKGAKGRTAGRLHNDTAYGIAGGPDKSGIYSVVHRISLDSLKNEKDIEKVRDPFLRDALLDAARGLSGAAMQAAFQGLAMRQGPYQGLRHVRISERLNVIPIADKRGILYKAFKGDANFRFDVWQVVDGTWRADVVSMFDAHQTDYQSAIKAGFPTARKVLRIYKDDLLAIEPDGGREIVRVVKFSMNGSIQLAHHNEGGSLKARDAATDDYFKYINTSAGGLRRLRARKVRVDELGRIFDPGIRTETAN